MLHINNTSDLYHSIVKVIAGIGGYAASALVRIAFNGVIDNNGYTGLKRTGLKFGNFGLQTLVAVDTTVQLENTIHELVNSYNDMADEIDKYSQYKNQADANAHMN